MVYVPVCGSTKSWAGKPLWKSCVPRMVPSGSNTCHCRLQHAVVPGSLKDTVWPAAPLKVYSSTDVDVSMFPAPVAGTPSETESPTAMSNLS